MCKAVAVANPIEQYNALAEQHQGSFDYQRGKTTKMIVELKLP